MAKRHAASNTPALFDTGEAPVVVVSPAPSRKRKKKDPSEIEPAKRLLDRFHVLFIARHGCKPIISGAKDTSLLKKLIATWGEPTVEGLIHEFLSPAQRDPRVLRSDFSVGAFYMLAQYLMLRKGRALPDDRTIGNIDAAARAMQPRA